MVSCQDKKVKSIVDSNEIEFKKSIYFNEERIKNAKYRVKYYGDVSAYSELSVYYSYNTSKKEEFLPYILLMVEKHKNFKYCTVAFNSFLEFYSGKENQFDGNKESLMLFLKNLDNLNINQKQYLLYFLEQGAIKNNFESINLLELLNREGIGVSKNLKKADSLKIVINELK